LSCCAAPLQCAVDHQSWLVEQDRRHIGAHQAAAERDLLLAIGGQAGGALRQHAIEIEHRGDFSDAAVDVGRRDAAVA
jgi:hypothetical protein